MTPQMKFCAEHLVPHGDVDRALLNAVTKRHDACARDLLRWYSGTMTQDGFRCSLFAAVMNFRLRAVKAILAKVDLEALDKALDGQDNTALMEACHSCQVECARALLAAGAPVNNVNSMGVTALHQAVEGGSFECCRLLVEAGADVNRADDAMITPLLAAAERPTWRIVRCLLEAGAHVNFVGQGEWAPLHSAVETKRDNNVKLLLRAGAEADAEILCRAMLCCSPPTLVNDLIAAARPGALDQIARVSATCPLICAARANNMLWVRKLLQAGAQANVVDHTLRSPLHEAAAGGYVECVDVLVDAGASVNYADVNHVTPLHEVAKVPDVTSARNCAKILLRAGANVNQTDASGETALMACAHAKKLELVTLLLGVGAEVDTLSINAFVHKTMADVSGERATETDLALALRLHAAGGATSERKIQMDLKSCHDGHSTIPSLQAMCRTLVRRILFKNYPRENLFKVASRLAASPGAPPGVAQVVVFNTNHVIVGEVGDQQRDLLDDWTDLKPT